MTRPNREPQPDTIIDASSDTRPSSEVITKGFGVRTKEGRLILVPPGYITFNMLVDGCGFSRKTVRSFISRGFIVADHVRRGWSLYKVENLEILRKLRIEADVTGKKTEALRRPEKIIPATTFQVVPYSTSESVAVFAMLKAEKPLADICLENPHLHPSVIQTIAKDYAMMSSSMLIRAPILDEINSLALEGKFPIENEQDLLHVMRLAAEEHKCWACKKRPRSNKCVMCLKHSIAKQAEMAREDDDQPTSTPEDSDTQ